MMAGRHGVAMLVRMECTNDDRKPNISRSSAGRRLPPGDACWQPLLATNCRKPGTRKHRRAQQPLQAPSTKSPMTRDTLQVGVMPCCKIEVACRPHEEQGREHLWHAATVQHRLCRISQLSLWQGRDLRMQHPPMPGMQALRLVHRAFDLPGAAWPSWPTTSKSP